MSKKKAEGRVQCGQFVGEWRQVGGNVAMTLEAIEGHKVLLTNIPATPKALGIYARQQERLMTAFVKAQRTQGREQFQLHAAAWEMAVQAQRSLRKQRGQRYPRPHDDRVRTDRAAVKARRDGLNFGARS